MKLEEKILDEFINFRNYVSHTLCKNRFFLYVNGRNIKAFTEPNVWPILKAEIEALYEMGQTLYGITCSSVFDHDRKEIEDAIFNIETLKNDLVWINDIEKHSDYIKKLLEDIPDKLLKADDFKIDIDKTKKYTTDNSESLKEIITQLINKKIILLIGHSNLDNNQDYWQYYPEIIKLIRMCIVQAIVEGQDEQFISQIRNIMQAIMYPDSNLDKLIQYGKPAIS